VLTVAEVAKRLRCSLSNAHALIAAGKLKAYRVGAGGGGLRVSEEHLQEFLRSAETRQGREETPAPEKASGFTVLDGDRLREAWKGR
jgi:excisionase family DNA binding protein